MSSEVTTLREKGNEHFKNGCYVEALALYTKALTISPLKDSEKSVFYKNKAACYLKIEKYDDVITDATKALEIYANDPKALFRRCQAFEKLDRLEEAYKDAVQLIKVEPKNTAILPTLNRLTPIIQEKIKQQNSTDAKVFQMFNLAFDSNAVDKEKRLQAANNLIVLAKEEAGAAKIMAEGGVGKLVGLASGKDPEFVLASLRVLSQLCDGRRSNSEAIYQQITPQQFLSFYMSKSDPVVGATSHLLQNIVTYASGVNRYKEAIKKYDEERLKGERSRYPQFVMDESAQRIIDEIFTGLTKLLVSNKITGDARDNVLQLLAKNLPKKDAIGWTKQFIQSEGIQNLMTIAGSVRQHKMLVVTEASAMHASVTLSKVYDDLASDKDRDLFKKECESYFRELLGDDCMESKVEAIEAVSVLLQGPYEVGNMLLGIAGVTEMMLVLANSENALYQKVAVEAIVNSASKKDKCLGMLKDAVPILKKLYKSSSDFIRVRALVGLCKLGSFGGTDASERPMADGSTVALSKGCRKYLGNKESDLDLRRWAVEGLAFLTLDADIKEELIHDTSALTSLIDIAKNNDKLVLYSAVAIFVNLTNSYDTADVPQEMIELAKYSKQHIPETHPLDLPEERDLRITKLAEFGVVSALVSLSTTDSNNSRELISRIFMSLASDEKLRGIIVQQGGARALIPLALENTENGRILAAHALAKVSVTMNPEIAFPGQRIQEVVRPLLSLLHPDRSALQNFESLLALTNLTSLNDDIRKRIVKEKGLSKVETYMFEEHELLRRAATECMCNLIMNEEVHEQFKGDNDRVKMFTLFCGDEDELLVRAAAGGLAMLTGDADICRKVIKVADWLVIIQSVAASQTVEIQHRGCYILRNMIAADDDIGRQIVESTALEVLMAVSRVTDPAMVKAKECAEDALKIAQEKDFIKPT